MKTFYLPVQTHSYQMSINESTYESNIPPNTKDIYCQVDEKAYFFCQNTKGVSSRKSLQSIEI